MVRGSPAQSSKMKALQMKYNLNEDIDEYNDIQGQQLKLTPSYPELHVGRDSSRTSLPAISNDPHKDYLMARAGLGSKAN